MNIDLSEWTDLKNMLAEGEVIATNGADIEIAQATLGFEYETRKWSSRFNKELQNGKITHWKYIS